MGMVRISPKRTGAATLASVAALLGAVTVASPASAVVGDRITVTNHTTGYTCNVAIQEDTNRDNWVNNAYIDGIRVANQMQSPMSATIAHKGYWYRDVHSRTPPCPALQITPTYVRNSSGPVGERGVAEVPFE